MNQPKPRIEPTFGEQPKVADNHSKTAEIKSPASISVSSSVSPGHTFTPVLKRPADSAQTLASLEEKAMQKEAAEPAPATPNSTTNAGGFAFAPVAEEPVQTSSPTKQAATASTATAQTAEPVKTEATQREPVMPTPAQNTDKTALTDKVPAKFRRLLLVVLLAIALLLVFLSLKPNTPKTVEALQEQGTSLPIEFRPVDEAEAKRAEEEARALQAAQKAEAEQQAVANAENNATAAMPSQAEQSETMPAEQAVQTNETAAIASANVPAVKPAVVEPIKKPATTGSVIYQPEVAKTEPKKVERLKPAAPKAEPTKAAAPKTATPAAAKVAEPKTAGIVSSKVLTVPKGVSLMQVFRDNHLNIADVNAMSKANNAVSRLKVGEKVTVRLDKNGRVAEMVISAGKYSRQANGTYLFK